mmetsp:Transcript_9923/g.14731  ORF Transcript_9923/g.14731 Transcript_9923/m.14731 type:complete len:150 (+) Transcript_9923:2080-2529(+)
MRAEKYLKTLSADLPSHAKMCKLVVPRDLEAKGGRFSNTLTIFTATITKSFLSDFTLVFPIYELMFRFILKKYKAFVWIIAYSHKEFYTTKQIMHLYQGLFSHCFFGSLCNSSCLSNVDFFLSSLIVLIQGVPNATELLQKFGNSTSKE